MRVRIERNWDTNQFGVTSKNGTAFINVEDISLEAEGLLDMAVEEPKLQGRVLKRVHMVNRRDERLTAKVVKNRARLDRWRERELGNA